MSEWIEALRKAVRAEEPAAVALRHDLHRHPDLSGAEQPTAERIRAALAPLISEPVAGPGLLARIGRPDGPAIAVRAELDALPVTEATGVPWSASGPSMHACGHDVHLAALTALCRAMSRTQSPVPAAMLAVFQPREEANPSGALDIVSSPQWAAHDVRAVIGTHVQPQLAPGTVAATAGAINAELCNVEITVSGSGGHAAYPHAISDPVLALCEIVVSLQQVVSRRISPTHAAVVSIGILRAGTAPGVIPPSAQGGGTLRVLDPSDMATLRAAVTDIAQRVAQAHRCEAAVAFDPGEPVLVNDDRLAAGARDILNGFGFRLAQDLRSCGADDFSYYAQRHPGLMMFGGVGNAGRGPAVSLHQATFCPPDGAVTEVADTLIAGFAAACQLLGQAAVSRSAAVIPVPGSRWADREAR